MKVKYYQILFSVDSMFDIFRKNTSSSLKEVSATSLANIITNLISAAFWLYIASVLQSSEYGEVSYLIAIATVATTFSSFGLHNTMIVYTTKNEKIQDSIYLLGVISACITAIIVFFIFGNPSISLFIIGSMIFTLAISEQLGLKSYIGYSKFVILQRIFAVIIAIFLYQFLGINGIVLGFALSYFPFSKKILSIRKTTSLSTLKPKFRFMMNNYAARISQNLVLWADKLIIFPLFGSELLGNYQLGIQVLALLTTLPNAVYNYLLPQDASGSHRKKIKTILVVVSILLTLLGVFVVPLIIDYFFPKYDDAVPMMKIVSLAVIPVTVNLIYMSKLLGQEKSKFVTVGTTIQLFTQMSTLVWLGNYFGILGMGASVVIGATSQAVYYILIDHLLKRNAN